MLCLRIIFDSVFYLTYANTHNKQKSLRFSLILNSDDKILSNYNITGYINIDRNNIEERLCKEKILLNFYVTIQKN